MLADAETRRAHVLCVDDAEPALMLRARILELNGYTVTTSCSPVRAVGVFASSEFDLAILDYEMPEMNGGELAARLKHATSRLPIILYTGSIDVDRTDLVFVDEVISKSDGVAALLAAVQRLLDHGMKTAVSFARGSVESDHGTKRKAPAATPQAL